MDCAYYKLFNDDLKNMNNAQLSQHYRLHGCRENRMINRKNFHEKYPEFDVEEYRQRNRDLQHFPTEFDLIEHFWIYGRFEKRKIRNEEDNDEYKTIEINGVVNNIKPNYEIKIFELSEESIWEYFSYYLDSDPRIREYISRNQQSQKDIIQHNLQDIQIKNNIGTKYKEEDYISTKTVSELPLLQNGFRREYNIFNKSLVENYTLVFFLSALYRKKMEGICLITKKKRNLSQIFNKCLDCTLSLWRRYK